MTPMSMKAHQAPSTDSSLDHLDITLNETAQNEPVLREMSPRDHCSVAVCPVCQGRTLIEIRGKLQCGRCHTICETCCEGGRI
jgi:hypothetical protein